MSQELTMTNTQAGDILSMIGVLGPAQVTRIKEDNHVFRIECGLDTFF